jgi:hypothetical protein
MYIEEMGGTELKGKENLRIFQCVMGLKFISTQKVTLWTYGIMYLVGTQFNELSY